MSTQLIIDSTRFRLSPMQYIAEKTAKECIVLHFTAGSSAESAYHTWNATRTRVATPYIVETDGRVFELFDPAHWAYHLGTADVRHEKRTIGIELVNVGPLKPDATDPNQLNWWPKNYGVKWCTRADAGLYEYAPHRGAYFYATFPEKQMEGTAALVAHLCAKFNIPRALPELNKRTQLDLKHFGSFRGIASHQNFRGDKFDIGPAFDWEALITPSSEAPRPRSPHAGGPSPSAP